MEATPLRVVNTSQVVSFLESSIITRFGIHESLVLDNSCNFYFVELIDFSLEKSIKVWYSTSYYGWYLA